MALRLVPCPPLRAAYALVSKYWSGGWKWGWGWTHRVPEDVDSHLEAPGTREAPMGWGAEREEAREARHLGQSPAQLACF